MISRDGRCQARELAVALSVRRSQDKRPGAGCLAAGCPGRWRSCRPPGCCCCGWLSGSSLLGLQQPADLDQVVREHPVAAPGPRALDAVQPGPVQAVAVLELTHP